MAEPDICGALSESGSLGNGGMTNLMIRGAFTGVDAFDVDCVDNVRTGTDVLISLKPRCDLDVVQEAVGGIATVQNDA